MVTVSALCIKFGSHHKKKKKERKKWIVKTTLCWIAFNTSKLLSTWPFNKVISKDKNRTCRWYQQMLRFKQHLSLGNDNPPGMFQYNTTLKGEATLFSKAFKSTKTLQFCRKKNHTMFHRLERVPYRRTVFGEGKMQHGPGSYSTYIHKTQGRCKWINILICTA